ncbi:MAG: replicative DNA helicase [Bdellovibrio sp.]|nr:MAG: replicative DNA helicase [Bdellovibrio sp.]
MAGRVPPQNIEAETSILGSLMLESEAWDQIGDLIEAEDFYRPSHQILFRSIKTLIHRNQPIDLITVTNFLQSENQLQGVGGPEYLIDLVSRTVTTANVESHTRIVREKSLLRRAIQISGEVIDQAYAEDFNSVDEFIDQSEEKFYRLGETTHAEGLVGPMDLVKDSIIKIEELYHRKAEVTGVPTGFTLLDKMTSGLQSGELVIIAARPSMGKTALALNVAQHIALRHKKTVAFFSLEMSREAVMMRLLASEARINMKDVRSGRISDSAWPKLIEAAGVISDSPFYIDETTGISPFELRTRCRRLKAQHGLDIVMIDYLQMMKLKERVESREREVSEISRTLKAIAKELHIPVIALAQLNRGVEGRTEKRPMLSDLRESGSLEQDADIIMMLYREDYYDKEDPEKQGHAEIIIGKQRNGPTGTVKLRFDAEYTRFRDADPDGAHPMAQPAGALGGPGPSGNGGATSGSSSPLKPAPGGRPPNFAPGASP